MGVLKKIMGFPALHRARKMTARANALLSNGDHAGARELYMRLESYGFVNFMTYHNIGSIYFEEGDLKAAEEYLKKAVGVNPQSVLSHSLLSEVYLRNRAWEQAEQAATAAAAADPFNYFIKKRRDKVFNKDWRREYVRSLETMEKAAEAQRSGDIEAALRGYETAVGADPKNALAHFLLGGLLFKEGNREKGLEHLYMAVEIEPGNRRYASALSGYRAQMTEGDGER